MTMGLSSGWREGQEEERLGNWAERLGVFSPEPSPGEYQGKGPVRLRTFQKWAQTSCSATRSVLWTWGGTVEACFGLYVSPLCLHNTSDITVFIASLSYSVMIISSFVYFLWKACSPLKGSSFVSFTIVCLATRQSLVHNTSSVMSTEGNY